jgi:hypothetical protein
MLEDGQSLERDFLDTLKDGHILEIMDKLREMSVVKPSSRTP